MTASPWQLARVSPDGTHHCVDECPLYEKRFFACCLFMRQGWRRCMTGMPPIILMPVEIALIRMFLLTLLAFMKIWRRCKPKKVVFISRRMEPRLMIRVMCGAEISKADSPLFSPIADIFIFSPDGQALYMDGFLYAGDFRERRAVVRLRDGLCTHIGEDGAYTHSMRYYDLDVYHKGFARARDERGWTHIDGDGMPLYDRRFAMAEPFYNGRALAETADGEIVTIDSCGRNIDTVLNSPRIKGGAAGASYDWFRELSADMVGYWKTYALVAAVKLSAAEKFPVPDGKVGAVLGLPDNNARVLLNALSELGVVRLHDNVWRLTEKGKFLHATHPFSLVSAALTWATFAEVGADCWLRALYGKANEDIFSNFAADVDKNAAMHKMLTTYARHDYALLSDMLPLDGIRRLIDAGGGNGTVASMIVNTHKEVNVIVLDRPEVLSFFASDTGADSRITRHSGDIFLPWNIKGDAVLLARVLHDWNDARAAIILRNARGALHAGGRLFVVESLKQNTTADGLCSLNILAVSGGRERMLEEYRCMMANNGFRYLASTRIA